jgi:hypothetical protein
MQALVKRSSTPRDVGVIERPAPDLKRVMFLSAPKRVDCVAVTFMHTGRTPAMSGLRRRSHSATKPSESSLRSRQMSTRRGSGSAWCRSLSTAAVSARPASADSARSARNGRCWACPSTEQPPTRSLSRRSASFESR